MFDKTQDLYVKACVIQNGVEDTQGDTLNAQEIKQIFTSFNNQNSFEIDHNGIPVEGVSLLENYISTTDEPISGTNVPAGSWLIVMKVTCPTIQEQIRKGVFGGVSLSNRVKSECACGLSGTIRYQDLNSAECVIPLYISLVEAGANRVGLDIFDYDTYILKSKKIGDVKLNIIEELKSLIQKAESEAPVIEKSAEEAEVAEEAIEEEPAEEPVIEKADAPEEDKEEPAEPEKEEDAKVEKECDDEKIEKAEEPAEEEADDLKKIMDRLDALEEKVKELSTPAKEEKEEEAEAKVEKTEEAVITKSAKVVVTDEKEEKLDFYRRTGRDPITGKKL